MADPANVPPPPSPALPGASPLADLALPERSLAGPEPVLLRELPVVGKLLLRGGRDVRERAGAAMGFEIPAEPLSSTAGDGAEALWLGPDEWLLLVPAEAAGLVADALGAELAGLHHALVPVGGRLVGVGIGGARAREVLAAGCALDLHPRAFPPGRVARTLLGKAEVVLHRPGAAAADGEDDGFALHLNRSLAAYAWRYLEAAAREFGYRIGGDRETAAPGLG